MLDKLKNYFVISANVILDNPPHTPAGEIATLTQSKKSNSWRILFTLLITSEQETSGVTEMALCLLLIVRNNRPIDKFRIGDSCYYLRCSSYKGVQIWRYNTTVNTTDYMNNILG